MNQRRVEPLANGLRVLVAGGHEVRDPVILRFCRELGKALINTNAGGTHVVVMTGGRGGPTSADRAVVEGAREALGEDSKMEIGERVVTFPQPGRSLDAPFVGTQEVVTTSLSTRQARRFAMTAASDVLVLVNGEHGTAEQAILSLALERPCVPLPFTGGQARTLWSSPDGKAMRERIGLPESLREKWERLERLPGDAHALTELATEVVERVVGAAALPCFVSMPYEPTAEKHFCETIMPGVNSAGMRVIRSDHGVESGSITKAMLAQLSHAAAVCALLTDVRYGRTAGTDGRLVRSVNPNVMYEIGYAQALRKPTILIAEDDDAIPFNLKVDRLIILSGAAGEGTASDQLAQMLRAVRNRPQGPK